MRISVDKRQFACVGIEGKTFGHFLNISKQSLSSKNLSRTHRQAPRKNTINLGHAPVYSEVNTPLTVNASGICGPLYGAPSGLIEPNPLWRSVG